MVSKRAAGRSESKMCQSHEQKSCEVKSVAIADELEKLERKKRGLSAHELYGSAIGDVVEHSYYFKLRLRNQIRIC
jgi:hypothetical protein